jgi:hypothetical protein
MMEAGKETNIPLDASFCHLKKHPYQGVFQIQFQFQTVIFMVVIYALLPN